MFIEQRLDALHGNVECLRRDVNDLHTIEMLQNIRHDITKKDLIVFIGTGQINENVLHSYLHFQKSLLEKKINFSGEALFIARSELELKLIKLFGYPCEIWKYQIELAFKLLSAKVAVLSSHLYSEWGDNLLTHCVAGAKKIQLWHGLPAKSIGASVINNNMDFHFFARLLNDCVNTDYVCIQNHDADVSNVYREAFPNAKQFVTGDCRNDIILNESFRTEFRKNKKCDYIDNWLDINKGNIKILYSPTYRENDETTEGLYRKIISLLDNRTGYKVAVKLHVGIIFSPEQNDNIHKMCNMYGHLYINSRDEVYSIFNEFDAMIVDYSSIRSDFALTMKPVLLWQFDRDKYERKTDVVGLFKELDDYSYMLPSEFSDEDVLSIIKIDKKKSDRVKFIKSRLLPNGNDLVSKTINSILEVYNADE